MLVQGPWTGLVRVERYVGSGGTKVVTREASTPVWSVLVATRDRHDQLLELLCSLLKSGTEIAWEVIVIDQSEREIGALLQAIVGDERVRYFRQDGKGKSRALNLALSLARGEILAFTDDDCVVAPDWLECGCLSVATSPDVGLAFGQMIPTPHDSSKVFIPQIQFTHRRVYRGRAWLSRGLLGMGGCMFGPAAVLRGLGGFDEDLGPGGLLRTGEECELTFRVLRHGFQVVQVPTAVVFHSGARSIPDGEAGRLLLDAFYAVAAGYGKNAGRGDLAALAAAVHEIVRIVRLSGVAIAKRQRPYHLRRLEMTLLGFRDGWRRGWCERRSVVPTPR
jgi:GT2 family glycosyltransferase